MNPLSMNPFTVLKDLIEEALHGTAIDHPVQFRFGSLFLSGAYFPGWNVIQIYFEGCWNATRRPNVEDFMEQLTWTLVHELCHKLGGWEHPDLEIENFL